MLKEIAMEQFIKPEVAQAFRENRIYIHDMDNYATGMHNCLFVDFEKLFREMVLLQEMVMLDLRRA